MRIIGIDLAWGDRNRTGLAVLGDSGRLLRSGSVTTDAEIAAFLAADALSDGVVAAIDAPLIVPNATGQRSCENELGRTFGRFHAGAYPANRTNPAFNPTPRGARISRAFGWDMSARRRPGSDRRMAIEVYPHPAMVVLFGLDRVIPYKRRSNRTFEARLEAFGRLLDGIEGTCGPTLALDTSGHWDDVRARVTSAARPSDLNRVEDEIDAVVCAYLGWMWLHEPQAMTVFGSDGAGFIVTPTLEGHEPRRI